MSSSSFAFVPADPSGRVRSPDRTVIRRHCMKGKNKKAGSRRSMREHARAAKARNLSQQQSQSPQSQDHANSQTELLAHRSSDLIPRPPPSDWALCRLAGELSEHSQKLMHHHFVPNPIRDAICPFGHSGMSNSLSGSALDFFKMLCVDVTSFRATVLLVSASDDLIAGRPLSTITQRHLRVAIASLKKALLHEDYLDLDVIIYTVGVLIGVALLFGDRAAATTHATGSSQLIRVRGGMRAFAYNRFVQLSLERMNFFGALTLEHWIPHYDGSFWEEPLALLDSLEVPDVLRTMYSLDGIVDDDLARVYRNLQYTSVLFDMHYRGKTPVSLALLEHCLGYLHHHLMRLANILTEAFSIGVCLHLMAFLGTTYRLPGTGVLLNCASLVSRLRRWHSETPVSAPYVEEHLNIWFILLFVMANGGVVEPAVTAHWKETGASGMPWQEVRGYLSRVMWTQSFHDDFGEKAYEAIAASCLTPGRDTIFLSFDAQHDFESFIDPRLIG